MGSDDTKSKRWWTVGSCEHGYGRTYAGDPTVGPVPREVGGRVKGSTVAVEPNPARVARARSFNPPGRSYRGPYLEDCPMAEGQGEHVAGLIAGPLGGILIAALLFTSRLCVIGLPVSTDLPRRTS
jgi:hypothetical protein